MAANDDVPNLEHVNGELHHTKAVEIRMHNEVCHVAMHEQFAGREANDLVCRHATVSTPDPEIIRQLLPRKLAEEIRISLQNLISPDSVVVKEIAERFHGVDLPRREMVSRIGLRSYHSLCVAQTQSLA